jgi:hypothetical protein
LDKIQRIEKLFYYIVAYSYLLIPIAFLFNRKKLHGSPLPFLALYGVLFCGLLLLYWELPRNLRMYHQTIYTFLEYLAFTYIFWKNIKSKKIKNFMLIATVLFAVFQINYMFNTKLVRLDSTSVGIETILIFIYIIYFFYEYSKTISDSYIYNHYFFWISVGVLMYLGGSFFFYIFINHLSDDQIDTFGNLTYCAEIFKNVLFATAIIIYGKNSKLNKKPPSVPYLDMI